jgi:hypothetical protein
VDAGIAVIIEPAGALERKVRVEGVAAGVFIARSVAIVRVGIAFPTLI